MPRWMYVLLAPGASALVARALSASPSCQRGRRDQLARGRALLALYVMVAIALFFLPLHA